MAMIIISADQIKEVRQEGIVYVDYAEQEQFIDFDQCYQNYLRKRLTPEAHKRSQELNPSMPEDYDSYCTRIRKWKEVGLRNSIGLNFTDGEANYGLPYFEFHTIPPVRIEFDTPEKYNAFEHEFLKAAWLEKSQWDTFDMT